MIVSESGVVAREKEYEALKSSPDFTWEDLLSHKFKETDCPSGTNPLVCLYANVQDSYRMGPIFYCSKRYESDQTDCELDENCHQRSYLTKCSASRNILDAASAEAELALLDTLPDGVDKIVFTRSSNCSTFTDQESCTGYCIWDKVYTYCSAKNHAIAQPFREIAEKSDDAFCRFFVLGLSSPCFDQYTEKSCNKKKFCQWDESGGCLDNEERYISAAANEDRKLKQRYKKSKKVCSKFKTKSICPV
eukprot:g8179.t1